MPAIPGSGIQSCANALRNVDLGGGTSDPIERATRQITGLASAGAQVDAIRAQDELLGTVLDLKA